MAWSQIAHVGASSTGGSNFTSSAIDTTGANLIIIAVHSYEVQIQPTLTDSKSNTWTGLTAYSNTGTVRTRIYYCYGGTVGSGHTFTITNPVEGATYSCIEVVAYSGAASSPFDVENGNNTGSASTLTTGSVTPSVNGELLIAAVGTSSVNPSSIDSSFTISDSSNYSGGNHFGGGMAALIQGTAGAINPTWTLSGIGAAATAIATFKVAAGGTTYTRSVSDNIALSDSIIRVSNSFRLTSDSIGLSDSTNRLVSYFRSISDNAGVSDSVARSGTSKRLSSDSLGLSDSVSRLANSFRLLSDFIAIGDSASILDIPSGAYLIRVSDALGLSDSAARQVTSLRLVSDSIGLADLFVRQATGLRVVSDSLGLVDAAYRSAVYQRVVADALAIFDMVSLFVPSGTIDPWTAYGDWAIPSVSGSWSTPSATGSWEDV